MSNNNKRGVGVYDPTPGVIRTGSVVSYDASTHTMQVRLSDNSALTSGITTVKVKAPSTLIHSNGLYIGALPTKNTPVAVSQSTGGEFFFAGYYSENLNILPSVNVGELLIHSTASSEIRLDLDSNIKIGSDINNIHVFAGSQRYPKSNLITINFENENHFTQGYREVGGLVKRDLRLNPQITSKLEDDSYDKIFSIIGMDPTATSNDLRSGTSKNPPLVEHREIVYEFQYGSNVEDDISESNKYLKTTSPTTAYTTENRRNSRADTMSLSLVAPNFLMEEVKGTVVDIFGGILDINRVALPVGLSADTTLRSNGTVATTNSQKSYQNIRALERKSIAYHFEINARKDPTPPSIAAGTPLDINTDSWNAKAQRSRFSFDVDKEGQFKLNAPASSETGNIPLLLRAENYSTFATTDSGNPNQTWPVQSAGNANQDIFVDSFASPATNFGSNVGSSVVFPHGSVRLVDGGGTDQGPVDRISKFVDNSPFNIRHGTAYHDILQTCYMQRTSAMLQYPTGAVDNVDMSYIATDKPTVAPPVSSTITVSGTGANAGGRSGSINLDGSLEFNIGANTRDRQSLWLDTAGGIVANIGRDLQGRSLVMGMDGHAFIQIGGWGIPNDSDARFNTKGLDGLVDGILDIRVFNAGNVHIIRFDSQGIIISTPGRMAFHAGQGMTLTSDADMEIDCETLTVQGRGFKKIFGGSG